MKYLKAFLIFMVAFMIQTSLLNLAAISGYTPNLLLCLTMVLSYMYDDRFYGLVFGAIFGLMYDICFGATAGAMALSFVAVALFIVFIRAYTNRENILSIEAVAAVSIVLFYFVYFALSIVGGCAIGFSSMLKTMIGSGIYDMVVITAMYIFLILRLKKMRRQKFLNRN